MNSGSPWDRVIVMPTSTEKIPNTSPTAASAGTDLNGAAAVEAARQIKARLRQVRRPAFRDARNRPRPSRPRASMFADGDVFDSRNPEQRIHFGELCDAARMNRIDLGAHGFYATPGVDYNRETGRGNPFLYYTQGAAVAEVEIDRFTGELPVPRVDLLIDIGRSINPGVDRGQVIGGFIQGMGWVTAECLVYSDKGELLSHSPTTYKIPAITDVPPSVQLRVLPERRQHRECRPQQSRRRAAADARDLRLDRGQARAPLRAPTKRHVDLRLPATGEEMLRCLTELDDGNRHVAAESSQLRTVRLDSHQSRDGHISCQERTPRASALAAIRSRLTFDP